MSEFTATLLTAAIQITLVSAPAAIIVWFIGRRWAAASATLAFWGLAVAALVSATAFAPLPNEWTWSNSAAQPAVSTDSALESVTHSTNYPAFDVGQLIASLRPNLSPMEAPGWTWSSAVALGLAAIMVISATRLFAGLMAIRNLRRRSVPIADSDLDALVHRLAHELGVRRPVELRSSPAIGSAAACGWRHPVVLLSADWRSWDSTDLRAVLAHELAHIRRRDYAIGIAARIASTICFHHPLALWLASRLRLAQEIAADELAAVVVGGRDCYRRALARMALRHDSVWLGGMAQTFGTNRNTLTRRLTMLLTERNRPMGRAVRASLIGLVVAIGVTVSAVRGTAEPPTAEAPAVALPAFDLGYLPENCDAFVAIRPGLLFGRPEMKPVLDGYSKMLNLAFAAIGVSPNAIPLDAVEQVVGPVELKILTEDERKRLPGGERHSISCGINFVRMNRDFDWAALLRSLPKTMPVTEKEPGVFEVKSPLLGPTPMTLRVLDARTIVGSSATAREAAERRTEISKRFGSSLLSAVDRAGMALVIDNKQAKWTEAVRRDPKMESLVTALGKPRHLAFCLHWNERVAASFLTDWDTAPTELQKGKESICKLLGESLDSKKTTDPRDRRFVDLATEMLNSVKVHAEGKLVIADLTSSTRWADLLNAIVLNGSASVEVKEEKSNKE